MNIGYGKSELVAKEAGDDDLCYVRSVGTPDSPTHHHSQGKKKGVEIRSQRRGLVMVNEADRVSAKEGGEGSDDDEGGGGGKR
ncbi:hypothetical protein Dimus_023885 [Dionaea muscipula]